MKNMNFKLKTQCGQTWSDVAQDAKEIATSLLFNRDAVEFDFNGVKHLVTKDTNLEYLWRDYSNSWLMGWKIVGPDCVEQYESEVQAEYERRKVEQDEKNRTREAELRAKDKKEREECELLTKDISLEFSDEQGWNESRKVNSDGYGEAALDYAELWAKKMQLEIAKGKSIADCYESTQNGLGFLGITGFQFGCAVSILAQTWKYGDELRKFHNKKYGHDEDIKGTANPALLTVTIKE